MRRSSELCVDDVSTYSDSDEEATTRPPAPTAATAPVPAPPPAAAKGRADGPAVSKKKTLEEAAEGGKGARSKAGGEASGSSKPQTASPSDPKELKPAQGPPPPTPPSSAAGGAAQGLQRPPEPAPARGGVDASTSAQTPPPAPPAQRAGGVVRKRRGKGGQGPPKLQRYDSDASLSWCARRTASLRARSPRLTSALHDRMTPARCRSDFSPPPDSVSVSTGMATLPRSIPTRPQHPPTMLNAPSAEG